MCTPGASFCEGTKLWACTKSGTDAVLTTECLGGTSTNPMGCFSNQCDPSSTACCRSSKPTCRWNLTSPTLSGSFYSTPTGVITTGQSNCYAPSNCLQDNSFHMVVYPSWAVTSATCGTSSNNYFYVTLTRPMTAPGEVLTLPNSRVSLGISNVDATKECMQWTGTVTWNSEVPDWSVTVNATCSETGKSGIRLVGTFSGDQ